MSNLAAEEGKLEPGSKRFAATQLTILGWRNAGNEKIKGNQMTNQIDPAHRLVVNGVALILAFTLIGTALLIYFGQHREIWATYATRQAGPSIEIRP